MSNERQRQVALTIRRNSRAPRARTPNNGSRITGRFGWRRGLFTAFLFAKLVASVRSAVTASPEFSESHGWHTAPVGLRLGTQTPGAAIWYTLDGSAPAVTNAQRYLQPLSIDRTTVVRARAELAGAEPSATVTHTYLFLADILRQTNRPAGWPTSWGQNKVDYGLDPRIATLLPWREQLPAAFAALPVVAVSIALSDLFDPETGLYSNPKEQGRAWERPAAVEIIAQDGQSVSANAGLRIRGGFSRDTAESGEP